MNVRRSWAQVLLISYRIAVQSTVGRARDGKSDCRVHCKQGFAVTKERHLVGPAEMRLNECREHRFAAVTRVRSGWVYNIDAISSVHNPL